MKYLTPRRIYLLPALSYLLTYFNRNSVLKTNCESKEEQIREIKFKKKKKKKMLEKPNRSLKDFSESRIHYQ